MATRVGMTLQEWMTAESLTDADVAALSGYHRTFVWKVRTGRQPPSRAAIKRFCQVSAERVMPADFFGEVVHQ